MQCVCYLVLIIINSCIYVAYCSTSYIVVMNWALETKTASKFLSISSSGGSIALHISVI